MLKTIVPAHLDLPVDAARVALPGGPGRAGEAVTAQQGLLQAAGLPGAWDGRDRFVILETGFGDGLNFLATWAAWRANPGRSARLHFLSSEAHPYRTDDLARLHAHWPEFSACSRELLASWPVLTPGFHRIALEGGRVQLTLMLSEPADALRQVEAAVDVFYLGASVLSDESGIDFEDLARLARPGAVAVRARPAAADPRLARAGFVCESDGSEAGAAWTRARFAGRPSARVGPAVPRHVAVIGAGVAGAAVAHALAEQGVAVTVLERAAEPAQAASGNPVAVFRPVISRDDNRATRLTRAAFLRAQRAWAALPGIEWAQCGVLHLAKDAEAIQKQQLALAALAPPADYAHWVSNEEASALADWPVAGPGVFYPTAGWIVPASLCRAWLAHPAITLRTGSTVSRLKDRAGGWQVWGEDGVLLAEADAVVLANARDAAALLDDPPWPLHTVRGQITQLPAGSLPGLKRVIAREGYVAPGRTRPLVGATYEHDDEDCTPRDASDLANLARLEAILPGSVSQLTEGTLDGRASLRATLPDRLPLLGPVEGNAALYVAAGYASRGVVWAGLLGEALADQMTGQPLPLERDLMDAIAPGRFKRR